MNFLKIKHVLMLVSITSILIFSGCSLFYAEYESNPDYKFMAKAHDQVMMSYREIYKGELKSKLEKVLSKDIFVGNHLTYAYTVADLLIHNGANLKEIKIAFCKANIPFNASMKQLLRGPDRTIVIYKGFVSDSENIFVYSIDEITYDIENMMLFNTL
jgi:hypothetical protein